MKTLRLGIVLLILIIGSTYSYAGLESGSEYDSSIKYKHAFRYEMKGELEVKPNRAHFPVTVRTEASSYSVALNISQTVLNDLTKSLKDINEPSFSISPTDFFKPLDYSKKIDISMFKNDDKTFTSNLNLFLTVNFAEEDDFWTRAGKIARALDFLEKFSKKFDKNDKISVHKEPEFYEIHNKENYREDIVNSIYAKAKKVADVIALKEGKKAVIKEVKFDQYIKEDISNFNRALLTIDANMEFVFE